MILFANTFLRGTSISFNCLGSNSNTTISAFFNPFSFCFKAFVGLIFFSSIRCIFSFLNPFKTNPPIKAKAKLLLPTKQILGCTAFNI